jgi:hypothetical protein
LESIFVFLNKLPCDNIDNENLGLNTFCSKILQLKDSISP